MCIRDRYSASRREAEDYYAMWAHQIKTPIAAMRLLLQQGAEPDRAAVSAELFRIEQYVEMVLSYQRLGSDTVDLVLRRVELTTSPSIRTAEMMSQPRPCSVQ